MQTTPQVLLSKGPGTGKWGLGTRGSENRIQVLLNLECHHYGVPKARWVVPESSECQAWLVPDAYPAAAYSDPLLRVTWSLKSVLILNLKRLLWSAFVRHLELKVHPFVRFCWQGKLSNTLWEIYVLGFFTCEQGPEPVPLDSSGESVLFWSIYVSGVPVPFGWVHSACIMHEPHFFCA